MQIGPLKKYMHLLLKYFNVSCIATYGTIKQYKFLTRIIRIMSFYSMFIYCCIYGAVRTVCNPARGGWLRNAYLIIVNHRLF